MITKEKLELVAELVFNGIPYLNDSVGVNEFFPSELREVYDDRANFALDYSETEDYPSEEEIETILSLFVTLGLFVREENGLYTSTEIANLVRLFYLRGLEGVKLYLEDL